jgi:hypothetical protein
MQVVGVVREDFEQPTSDDLGTVGHRRRKVGVGDGHDPQLGVQDEVRTGRGLEQAPEVRQGKAPDVVAPVRRPALTLVRHDL